VEIEGQYHNVYVIKRPGVDQFMKRVGELYEVVVFTASVSKVSSTLASHWPSLIVKKKSTGILSLTSWTSITLCTIDCSVRVVIITKEITSKIFLRSDVICVKQSSLIILLHLTSSTHSTLSPLAVGFLTHTTTSSST
jgi:hypothetical protein